MKVHDHSRLCFSTVGHACMLECALSSNSNLTLEILHVETAACKAASPFPFYVQLLAVKYMHVLHDAPLTRAICY